MRSWQLASAAFFFYVAAVAFWQGLSRDAARRAIAGAGFGLIALVLSLAFEQPALTTWIWPPLLLLIGYRTSGLLFVAARPSHEAALGSFDVRANVRSIACRVPRPVVELLEAAYAGVYLLVPIALAIRFWFLPSPGPDTFWTVVLVTDYICFGALPWVQTRPPRALELDEPWVSSVRRFNLRLLGATSIQVNTFPSGHAAEALVAAIMVVGAPSWIVLLMFLAACAVSAGAVLGRYHYLLDAIVGWMVAIIVFEIAAR